MTERIVCAFSGDHHVPVPAPQWDYEHAQRLSFSSTATPSAVINAPLVRLIATEDCFYTIGSNPSADNATKSVFLPAGSNWAETITAGEKVSVISNGADGFLFIIPAKTES